VSELPEHESPAERRADVVRAERSRAFIYGTIATLIAMAGFESVGGAPIAAGAIIAVSAVATWWAHAYSTVLAARLTSAHPITPHEVASALREAWPIVTAAIPATLLSIGAGAGLWTLTSAILVANLAGITVMAIAGLIAARSAHAGRLATLGWIAVTAAIGAIIVLVEAAVHR
jgi:hypothetical protein